MILMRNKKIIAKAKREHNLFTLDLADLDKAMVIIRLLNYIKHCVMAMTGQECLIYLVS